jgi:2-oxoisovalerate dehydrogenase E1 component alpha subunit
VLAALKSAEKEKKPPITDLFTDVYDTVPAHLQEQEQELQRHFAKYSDKYKLDAFADSNDANRS